MIASPRTLAAVAATILLLATCKSRTPHEPSWLFPAGSELPESLEGAGPEPGILFNQAGCDGFGDNVTCGNIGQCCDDHDACIDQHCPAPYGHVNACAENPDECPDACEECHAAVSACALGCAFGGEGCGPSDCCPDEYGGEDSCGEEQACYDHSTDPPELITDPCECERRGIELSPEPPRPRTHCCDATGYGCCVELGGGCGDGEACCNGLTCTDGSCQSDDSGDYCGDGQCGPGESTYHCPEDCTENES